MRLALLISIIGLILSAWGKWEYSSPLRWNPLDEKPIPKPESTATFYFWSASGRFSIDILLPMSKQEESATQGLAINSQVSCNVVVELYAGDVLINASKINTLQQSGAIFSDHMNCFNGGVIAVPRLGRYWLKIQNMGNDPLMSSGKLSLIRRENTENAAVLSGVFRLLIWIFIGMILLIGISKVIKHRHRPAMQTLTT
jgi:hypothetical protein